MTGCPKALSHTRTWAVRDISSWMFELISSGKTYHTENIAHHSFILYWSGKKIFLVQLCSNEYWAQVLGQATGTWFRSQAQWETHLDMIKRHSAAAKQLRQGRDSKTHSKMNSYTLEVKKLIPWWCKEWLICWWPHVGIFQLPLKTPGGFFVCVYLYIIYI